jgi:hypothetical protein
MTISVDSGLFKPGHSIAHVLAENHPRIDFAQVRIVDSDERRRLADFFVPDYIFQKYFGTGTCPLPF